MYLIYKSSRKMGSASSTSNSSSNRSGGSGGGGGSSGSHRANNSGRYYYYTSSFDWDSWWFPFDSSPSQPSRPSSAPSRARDPPKPAEVYEEEKEKEPENKPVIVIKKVDLNIHANSFDHNTHDYDITRKKYNGSKHLVVRRGQAFDILLTFDRDYDKEMDDLSVYFATGDEPMETKSTMVKLNPEKEKRGKQKWTCKIGKKEDLTYTLKVTPDAKCIIGKWYVRFETKLKNPGEDNKEVVAKKHGESIYILFNAWCKDDQVYMEDKDWLDEAVLNDAGHIYTGNSHNIGARQWNFGQFEDFMIDNTLYLLSDIRKLNRTHWHDPVVVARALSSAVNASDNNGVLIGNWSGDYSGGTKPTKWSGSTAILRKFWETKKPVKFGQCWVFSGLTTAVCRSIGLPTRSVTNFTSAHDTDATMTIDKHFIADTMEVYEKYNQDSIWNFHVWNEMYSRRPDCGDMYDGWQAFDATPQETSEGYYQCGPCPLKAIKEGDVSKVFDGPFIFAEVNADVLHWIYNPETNEWSTAAIKEGHKTKVGEKISTQKPRKQQGDGGAWGYRSHARADRHDITLEYKYAEGSAEERKSVKRANQFAENIAGLYDTPECVKDCDAMLVLPDNVEDLLIGQDCTVTLTLMNQSKEVRTFHGHFWCRAVQYTGVPYLRSPIKLLDDQEIQVEAESEKKIELNLLFSKYYNAHDDASMFRVEVALNVKETGQQIIEETEVDFDAPDMFIEGPDKVEVNMPTEFTLWFENPVPNMALTNGEWSVEGPARDQTIKQGKTDSKRVETKVTITPQRPGFRWISAEFDCDELKGVVGAKRITVEGDDEEYD